MGLTRAHAEALDAADPLASFRARFAVADPDLCYLDGNSLGRLPLATIEHLRAVVEEEWGRGLVESWDTWIDLPTRVGDAIAPLIGAAPGEVIVADSTTVNLHDLVDAACQAAPERSAIVIADGDFPTDRYVVAGVAASRGMEVRTIPTHPIDGPTPDDLATASAPGDVAVAVLSAVDFRSGAILDLRAAADAAHGGGARLLADLSHAAGVVPVDLRGSGVDLAVGCTYKFLCGGPGAQAFLYVAAELLPTLRRPTWGWFAQRDQFVMGATFDPADDIRRFLAGTPPILALAAVEEGVRLVAEAGIAAIRAKSLALGALTQSLVEERLVPLGFDVASPADAARRGGHFTIAHPDAVRIGVGARARGVIPDVRPPDRIRLGLSPLTTTFAEVWEGIERIAIVVEAGEHRRVASDRQRVT